MNSQRPWAARAFLAFVLLVLGYVLLIPEYTYYYRSTKDSATKLDPWQDYVRVSGKAKFVLVRPQQFVVKSDTIYLLARRTTSLPLFMAVLGHYDKVWSIGELNMLSSNHVELKSLWPDPSAENLGVQWIK